MIRVSAPARRWGQCACHFVAADRAAGEVRNRDDAPERWAQLILAIVLPLLAMVGLTVTPLLDGLGSSRINVAVPGILALCAMSTAFTGQGIATGFDRRYGVLRFLSTTPLGRTGLIAGKVLAVLVVLFLQVIVVGGGGVACWAGGPEPAGWLPGLALLVLGAASLTALGLLVAGTVRPEATLAITNLLWILLGALGGIVIPEPNGSPALAQAVVRHRLSGALGQALRDAFLYGSVNVAAGVLSCCSGRQLPAAQQPVGSSGIEKTVSTASRPSRIASRFTSPRLPVTVDKTGQAAGRVVPDRPNRAGGDRRGRPADRFGARLFHLAALHGRLARGTPPKWESTASSNSATGS